MNASYTLIPGHIWPLFGHVHQVAGNSRHSMASALYV